MNKSPLSSLQWFYNKNAQYESRAVCLPILDFFDLLAAYSETDDYQEPGDGRQNDEDWRNLMERWSSKSLPCIIMNDLLSARDLGKLLLPFVFYCCEVDAKQKAELHVSINN